MKYVRSIFKCLVFCILLVLLFAVHSSSVFATENPLKISNNKVGIHILFPEELDKAAALVNSNGGDWGYVVIPIQSGDKNLVKWQSFMNEAKKVHVIPLIRLATEGDYFNTQVWRVPTPEDVLDFANFLNALSWPTKNRYIIVYNEVNRGDEWGGKADPSVYANLLSYAVTAFKQRSPDFFIISAGMDNAAATTDTSINEYDYFAQMDQAVPGIFNQIDGFASHSYPNPAFSQPPTFISKTSITSFQFERNLLETLSSKQLPVFITETGWEQDIVGENLAAEYLSTAFQTVWTDANIVTIAPFLLQAGSGPFTGFSLIETNGTQNAVYQALYNLPKTHGAPTVNQSVLSESTTNLLALAPQESFSPEDSAVNPLLITTFKSVLKWFWNVH